MKLLLCALIGACAAAGAADDNGRKEEAVSCVPCHSLRIVHIQRLSRPAWGRELDKMVRWGAVIKDRDALLEYLAANFGDDKPVPEPPLSEDGVGQAKPR